MGAEISATLSEQVLTSLQAPVRRVTGDDTVMPYYRNEQLYLPDVDDILIAVRETMEYSG
jgi:pyruvate dehydrogenase E1 component beta subunit